MRHEIIRFSDWGIPKAAHFTEHKAHTSGRDYVIPDDVMRLAISLLGHRLSIKAENIIDDQC